MAQKKPVKIPGLRPAFSGGSRKGSKKVDFPLRKTPKNAKNDQKTAKKAQKTRKNDDSSPKKAKKAQKPDKN